MPDSPIAPHEGVEARELVLSPEARRLRRTARRPPVTGRAGSSVQRVRASGPHRQCVDLGGVTTEQALDSADNLAQTGYCLADKGKEYVVFQAGDKGEFNVNLKDGPGPFTVEWFDVNKSNSIPGKPVSGGGARTFSTPFGGPAVLYLRAR